MTVAPASLNQTAGAVPGDLAATRLREDWRDVCAWPTPYADMRQALQALLVRYMAYLDRLANSDERATAILAGHSYLSIIAPAITAALAASAERDVGTKLEGEAPEFAFLRSKGGQTLPRLLGAAHSKSAETPRAQWLRRLIRTASWTDLRSLPGAVLAPRKMAISHNKLLKREARLEGRVGFRHADVLLSEARANPSIANLDVTRMTEEIATLTGDVAGIDAPVRTRLTELARSEISPLLTTAASDLTGLRWMNELPLDIWAGSGGYWPSRAIGLEVLRRGGTVTRFSHNGCEVLVSDRYHIFPFIEMCATSTFVLGTEGVAQLARETDVTRPVAVYREIELRHADGLPPFDGIPVSTTPPRRSAHKPHVLFVPSVLVGQRGLFPPLLPDVMSLDWQLRMAEMLLDMPIDLLCKPHPEGILKGQPQPVAEIAPVSHEPFESHLEWTDVFVFDRAESTTFWEAVCTDRPIVYLDAGLTEFIPQVRPLIENRCRRVAASFDERNRPIVDREELRDAILGDHAAIDPSPLRRLLAGGSKMQGTAG